MIRRSVLALVLIATGVCALPVLRSGQTLMARDLPTFHAPLRTWFWAEALELRRLPEWNPAIHQGQPTLSNPNYTAFYPPSWLGLVLPAARALAWTVWLHVIWGAAGFVVLARRLGGGLEGGATMALAFGTSASVLGLVSALPMLCGLAWLPWVVAFGLAALGGGGWRCLVAAALAMTGQLVGGDPVVALISVVMLGLVAAAGPAAALPRGRLRALVGVGVMVCMAAAFGAVQLIPTAVRLLDSPRGGGARAEEALRWSLPPSRLLELVLPKFHGDPLLDEAGRYLGWGVNDGDYPYLPVLGPGMVVLAFALAGLSKSGPWRRYLLLVAAAGVFLALGRHNPGYELLRQVPPLSWVRYPEKWLLLTMVSLFAAAALGVRAWVEDRDKRAGWLAVGLAAVAAGWWLWLGWGPSAGWIGSRAGGNLAPGQLVELTSWMTGEARLATVVALVVAVAILLATRFPPGKMALGLGVVLLVAGFGNTSAVLLTVPREFLARPPVVASLEAGERVLTTLPLDGEPDVGLRVGPVGAQQLIGRVRRLDPYSGLLFGVEHALHPDYDLMHTRWARYAQEMFEKTWDLPAPSTSGSAHELGLRLAGSWAVGSTIWRRPLAEVAAEARHTGRPPELVRIETNPYAAARVRAVSRLDNAANLESAAVRAAQSGFDSATVFTAAPALGESRAVAEPSSLRTIEGSDRWAVEWSSTEPSLLLVARTFDSRWTARGPGGSRHAVWPTALGQMVVELPATGGEMARMDFAFHDPAVTVGLWITLGALVASALAWVRGLGR